MANKDFTKDYKDYARFIPAVSEMYGRFLVSAPVKRNLPKNIKLENLNFFDKKDGFIFIPGALYSAGQAARTKGAANRSDAITNRDKNQTFLVGDSGGFQIQTGAIKFKGDETKDRLMKWMERNCDWSMILDFPTGGINAGTIDPHITRLNSELAINPYLIKEKNKSVNISSIEQYAKLIGLDPTDEGEISYSTCLLQTIINNDYFIHHRTPGATNFLNVVQGRTNKESSIWYERVKHYQFEGWSMASWHRENLVMMMSRLVDMYHDNLLENKDWMHILGVGKLPNGCIYTTIQRCVREHVNPKFTISYDVSSPFTTTAFGNVCVGHNLDKKDWALLMKNIDHPDQFPGGSKHNAWLQDVIRDSFNEYNLIEESNGGTAVLSQSEVSKRLQMSDLCVLDPNDPKYASSWDLSSYIMLMHHNLQSHLEAVLNAQNLYDSGDTERTPIGILRLKELIPDIFNVCVKKGKKQAYNMIERFSTDLNYMSGEAAKSGVALLTEFDLPQKSVIKSLSKKIKEDTKINHPTKIADEDLWG